MSTTGNDSNNCANPNTPCLTFAGSLAQVAVGGEVIAEATGGYGAINVTQSVTISGPPGVVIYSGFTVTVNAPGATVVLRGLTIDGTGATGNGINVVAVSVLHVESCVITGFAGGSGPSGHGIYFTSAGQLFVKDTIIRGKSSSASGSPPPRAPLRPRWITAGWNITNLALFLTSARGREGHDTGQRGFRKRYRRTSGAARR